MTYIAVTVDVAGCKLRRGLRSVNGNQVIPGEFLIVASVSVEPSEFTREPSIDTASAPVGSGITSETTSVDPAQGVVSPSFTIADAVE